MTEDHRRAPVEACGGESSPPRSATSKNESAKKPRDPLCHNESQGLLNSRGRTRTCDPLINSQLLYQLSYTGSPGMTAWTGGSQATKVHAAEQ